MKYYNVFYRSELNRKYGLLSALQIQRIIVNNLATIVFWEDGTKTVVKISDSDMENGKYDIYAGVSYAIAKKLFGTNSAFKREVDRKVEDKSTSLPPKEDSEARRRKA